MKRIIWDYLQSFIESVVLFSIPFIIFFTVSSRNIIKGAALGLSGGLLFGLGILAYILVQEKEARGVYKQISGNEKIIYYATANMFVGNNSTGGRLFLTEKGIRFREIGIFGKNREKQISYTEIEAISPAKKMNCVTLLTKREEEIVFAVHHRKGLIELIRSKLA